MHQYIKSANLSVSLPNEPHYHSVMLEIDTWEGEAPATDETIRTRRIVMLDPASALHVQHLLINGSGTMLHALGRYLELREAMRDTTIYLALSLTRGVPQVFIDA